MLLLLGDELLTVLELSLGLAGPRRGADSAKPVAHDLEMTVYLYRVVTLPYAAKRALDHER